MYKVRMKKQQLKAVFFDSMLPKVFVDSDGNAPEMSAEKGMVYCLLATRSMMEVEDIFTKSGRLDDGVVDDIANYGAVSVAEIPSDIIASTFGLNVVVVRRFLHGFGGEIDISPIIGSRYFPLLLGRYSNVEKGERVDGAKIPLKGLPLILYSYLVDKRDQKKKVNRRSGVTASLPVIDTWESTLAKEMGIDKESVARNIWKLERNGWLFRFKDEWGKTYIWINDIPKPKNEMRVIVNKKLNDQ